MEAREQQEVSWESPALPCNGSDGAKALSPSLSAGSQIVSEDVAKKTCEEHQLCVVAVLPHILDTGTTNRNSLL